MGTGQTGLQVIKRLVDAFVFLHDGVALPGEGVVFALLGADARVLEEVRVCPCKFFKKRALLVVSLEDAILMWTKFLELGFEQLRFLVCNCLLVQDQDVGNIVRVDLSSVNPGPDKHHRATLRFSPCLSGLSEPASSLS